MDIFGKLRRSTDETESAATSQAPTSIFGPDGSYAGVEPIAGSTELQYSDEAASDSEEDEDPEFLKELEEVKSELGSMSIEALMQDALDDTARGDLEEDIDNANFHMLRATAMGNRAIALILLQQKPVQ